MKILYISALISSRTTEHLANYTQANVHNAVQKFSKLIANGFVKNGASVINIASLPISRATSKKLWWNIPSDNENGMEYRYSPFVNLPGVRHLFLFLYSFFLTLLWGIKEKRNKFLVCDVLNISLCMGGLLASKIIGLKSMGIMTDMPGLMVGGSNKKKKAGIISYINKSYLSSFSCYVFLTEQMNTVINKKQRPYIVMEGLVDENMADVFAPKSKIKTDKKVVLYAGTLHERYGLKTLVEAFMLVKDEKAELWLYGNGPFVPELKEYCKQNDRIIYHGVVPNDQVVDAELAATLLVNPRPTTEEFTLYSFPSKNMEYMVSGTPVLTTCLPGMPSEYHPHVYLFNDETVEGYAETLNMLLEKSKENLQAKGLSAKQFVLEKKNNVVQTSRMIKLAEHTYKS